MPSSGPLLRDPSTFSTAFQRHAPDAFAAAHAVLRDRHAAEDVVQDVFAALWARPEAFAPERGALGVYIRVMARSRALDRLRSAAAAGAAAQRLRSVPVAEPAAAETVERREVIRELAGALDRLPAAQRAAVLLHHVRGLGDRELAEVTGVPLGTAKSRIRLGTGRIRESLPAAA